MGILVIILWYVSTLSWTFVWIISYCVDIQTKTTPKSIISLWTFFYFIIIILAFVLQFGSVFFVCFFNVENEMKGQLCRSNFECNSRKCLRFSYFLLLKEWGCFTCQKTCYVFFWQVKYLKIVFKKARKTSDIWNY